MIKNINIYYYIFLSVLKYTNTFLVMIMLGEIPVPIPNTEVKP